MTYPAFRAVELIEEDEKNGGSVYIYDLMQDKHMTIPRRIYDFALQLTGKVDPRTIPGYAPEERASILEELRQCKLLRGRRVFSAGLGTFYFPLLYVDLNARLSGFAGVWNLVVLCAFLPVLALGLFCLWQSDVDFEGSVWLGSVSGLLPGMLLHEFSHASACVAFGGEVHEMGLMIANFVPGAYVYMDSDRIPGRLRRLQVTAAGPETNLLLAGVFFFLTSFLPFDGFFYGGALANVVLALINLVFVSGFDGAGVIGELLGWSVFVPASPRLILRRSVCRRLRKRPYGWAVLFTAAVFSLFQLLLPLLIFSNILWIFRGVFS